MSINKILTGIFAIFAVASESAGAAPSVRQLGTIMQKSAGSDASVGQQKARAATAVGPKTSPSVKPITTSAPTISTASTSAVDSSRLGGVPFTSGKTNKNNSSNTSGKTYSASTALVSMEKDFEKLQNDYIALQNNYTAMQQNMAATAEQIRQEAGQQISAAVQQQQADLNSMNTNITSSLGQVQSQIATLSQDAVKKAELDTELNKAPTIAAMNQSLARKADAAEVQSTIETLATKEEVNIAANGSFTQQKFDEAVENSNRLSNLLAEKAAKTEVTTAITNATKDLAAKDQVAADIAAAEARAFTDEKVEAALNRSSVLAAKLSAKVEQADVDNTVARVASGFATKDSVNSAKDEMESKITAAKQELTSKITSDVSNVSSRVDSVETAVRNKIDSDTMSSAISNATRNLVDRTTVEGMIADIDIPEQQATCTNEVTGVELGSDGKILVTKCNGNNNQIIIPDGEGCQKTTHVYTPGTNPKTVTIGNSTITGVTVRGYRTTTISDTCEQSKNQVTVTQDSCHLAEIGVKITGTSNIDLYMCMPQSVCAPGVSCMASPYYLIVENGGVSTSITTQLERKQDTLSTESLERLNTAVTASEVDTALTTRLNNFTTTSDKITDFDTHVGSVLSTNRVAYQTDIANLATKEEINGVLKATDISFDVTNDGFLTVSVKGSTPERIGMVKGTDGAQGDPGMGINYKGQKDTYNQLPTSGNVLGDAWQVMTDGLFYIWDGEKFPPYGSGAALQGPQGPKGTDGANGKDGKDGVDGQDGKDAYDLAKESGFAGSKDAWLESLRGEKGADGRDGVDGKDGATGPQGPQGEQGPAGKDGVDGSSMTEQDIINLGFAKTSAISDMQNLIDSLTNRMTAAEARMTAVEEKQNERQNAE